MIGWLPLRPGPPRGDRVLAP